MSLVLKLSRSEIRHLTCIVGFGQRTMVAMAGISVPRSTQSVAFDSTHTH